MTKIRYSLVFLRRLFQALIPLIKICAAKICIFLTTFLCIESQSKIIHC